MELNFIPRSLSIGFCLVLKPKIGCSVLMGIGTAAFFMPFSLKQPIKKNVCRLQSNA
jgi:hypothetical protein